MERKPEAQRDSETWGVFKMGSLILKGAQQVADPTQKDIKPGLPVILWYPSHAILVAHLRDSTGT